eukprot:c4637_g1_i1.p1 GENE.c4637_g1_i1~~c4637_g1_i1.p1  ORF type:complete len:322 (-),score=87.67 c4637_g1_i1:9-974(-)
MQKKYEDWKRSKEWKESLGYAQSILTTLNSADNDQTRIHFLGLMKDFCRSSNLNTKKMHQSAVAEIGFVQKVIDLCKTTKSSELKASCFLALGQMSFQNKYAGSFVSSNHEMMEILIDSLTSTNEENELIRCSYAIVIIASNDHSSHYDFLVLLPKFRKFLDPTTPIPLRANAVRYYFFLSFNEDKSVHSQLISTGAIPLLIEIMESRNIYLRYTTAAMAIANLTGSSMDDTNILSARDILTHIVDVYRLTIQGKPYPISSNAYYTGWHVAYALKNLAQMKQNRSILIELGITEYISQALISSDQLLVEHSLILLWSITEQ